MVNWVDEVGSDFRHGNQNELTLVELGMGNFQIKSFYSQVIIEKDIDVNRPGAPGDQTAIQFL